MSAIWVELMILQTIVGYCFVVANALIGLTNVKDLNNLKGDVRTIKYHKIFGKIEGLIFYIITIQCLYMFAVHVQANDPLLYVPSGVWAHSWIGGFSAVVLVTFKLIIARYKKDEMYKYGKYIGPIGVLGWSLSHWTSLVNYYFISINYSPITLNLIPNTFLWAAVIPFLFGTCLYLIVLLKGERFSSSEKRINLHGVAMILHGITFGYERSAKELVGAPVLYKYVFPKTYEFLERYSKYIGLDLEELKNYNLNEAMQIAMQKFENIGMAEKLKIDWISENEFSVESINCSTAVVRSYMKPTELTNSICPWGILAATIVNALTGKNIEIEPSQFNEIGAKSKLKIVAEEKNTK
jgi:hypothetical protein